MPPSSAPPLRYRPMVAADIGRTPSDCHGAPADLEARVADLGAAAILAFDADQHVGQLQFRRHQPELRSASGLFSPDYWGDFAGRAPTLPAATLGVFCYHVGQLTDGELRDARYQGRGIGTGLLDTLLAWAQDRGFAAVVAKSVPDDRAIMAFMGGQPERAYTARGFECLDRWIDEQLHATVIERGLADSARVPETIATVGLCVRRLRG